MKHRVQYAVITALLTLFLFPPPKIQAQAFLHPGIDQSAKDLAHMKDKVLKGEQPWKAAYDRVKAAADTSFETKTFTHVLRGPYGRPNIGGDDLSKAASMAYNYALVWYITKDKTYAARAIGILNAWSLVLWDLDYNDAKLLAAWTGSIFCNAAEILRYTDAGWQQKDIDRFSEMLVSVYYPLMRFYYPQANGNWDGAIIHSILAIAIFTDNRPMFNNGIEHFLHGTFNGSIFKYIFPSGQCQESTRDQGHVQLGLGEFAGAAQVAFTQGTDLFSIGNNRLALGYEYTASFVLGETPPSYGVISPRAKTVRDDYEYIFRHYQSLGVELPHVQKAADVARANPGRSVLTSVRAPFDLKGVKVMVPKPGTIARDAGAKAAGLKAPADAIIVQPGGSIQQALDAAAGSNTMVLVKAGVHTLPHTLKIPSGSTLAGEGDSTRLFLSPSSGDRDALANATDDLHDITIRDLVIEGATQPAPGSDPNSTRSFRNGPNRGGIVFRALHEGQMKHLNFINLTVQNCTYNGIFITGATDVVMTGCDFNENGANVIPGPKLQHNVLLGHCNAVKITGSRLDTSPFGSGLALDHCREVVVSTCEIARNAYYGIVISTSSNVSMTGSLVEGNDRSGVMLECLQAGNQDITVTNNVVQYNAGFGVESYASKNTRVSGNTYAGNGQAEAQEKISADKRIVME